MENEELLEKAEEETPVLETCITASESTILEADAEDFEKTDSEEEETELFVGFTWKQIAAAVAIACAVIGAVILTVKLIKKLKK